MTGSVPLMAVGTSPYNGGAEMLGADPIRVLIADDEPALRIALADLLAHEDHVMLIGTAGDADEAIQIAHDQRPDVALVDVKMPAGGGPRAAREITRLSPDTRVIALSAFEDRPTVLEMLRAGAVGYLVKGTAGEEILDSIEKVMAGGASLSSEVIAGIVYELTQQFGARTPNARSATPGERRSNGSWPAKACPWSSSRSWISRPMDTVGLEALARFHSLPLRPPNEWFAEAVAHALGVRLEVATVDPGARDAGAPPRPGLPGGQLLTSCRDLPRHHPVAGTTRLQARAGDHRTRGGRGLRAPGRGVGPPSRAWVPGSRSTTRAPGSRACGTRCGSRPTS